MTNTDELAVMLKGLTAKQLQQLLSANPNRDGSQIRAKRNARTEAYFEKVRAEGLYPFKFEKFTQFREVLK